MNEFYVYKNFKFNIINNILNDKSEGLSDLIDFAFKYGFKDNIWHKYIAYELAYNENIFSIACENNGNIIGNNSLILHDLEILFNLYNKDLNKIDNYLSTNIKNFNIVRENKQHGNKVIFIIDQLSNQIDNVNNIEELYTILVKFYQTYGVGDLGFHKAFRINDSGSLIPINNVLEVSFDDLVGYEWQKKRLIHNTNAFVSNEQANNVLLYGDSGTGKSTSIKALLNLFYPKGLRMIEVYKHQMKYVADIMANLRNRNYSFILYMDDLSFEEDEVEYKYLKSIIEGGLESKPSNVLVYATSNRRHLIKETMNDNGEILNDLHRNETKAEKLSLSARFGVQILYLSPDNKEFKKIVSVLAKKYGIKLDESELMLKASQWEIKYGSLSGRTAEQFVKYISSGANDI